MKLALFTLLLILGAATIFAQPHIFNIDANKTIGENTKFWKAAGTDLRYYLTEKPCGQALIRMDQTTPCVYLKSHYSLIQNIREGLEVGIEVYSEDKNGNAVCDFGHIKRAYVLLSELKLV